MKRIFPHSKPSITSIEYIKEYKEMREMLSRFSKAGEKYSQGACYASGLSEGQKNALCALVMSDDELFSGRHENGTGIVLCQDEKSAYAMNSYLSSFGLETAVFPARDYNFHNISATSHEWEYERLKVLRRVLSSELDAVVAVPDAAFGILPEPEKIKDGLVLEIGKSISIEKVLETLEMYGYSFCDTVEGPGQYSRRGDILDVFVPDFENPVRFEFFGDEIDASGFFDVMTQRRTENVMSVSINPVRECMPDGAALDRIYERMDSLIASAKRKKNTSAAEKLMKEKADLENGFLPNIDKYIPLMYDRKCTLFDYAGGSVFVCDYPRVRDRLKSVLWQTEQDMTDVASAGEADLKDAVFCLDNDSAKIKMLSRPCIITDTFNSTPDIEISGLFEFSSKHTSMSVENLDILCEDLEDYKKSGYRIQIAVRSALSASELSSLLTDRNIANTVCSEISYSEMQSGFVYITPKADPAMKMCGFECSKSRFVLLSDEAENVSAGKLKKSGTLTKRQGKNRIQSYLELTVGDIVVHDVHGIGMYDGIKTLTAAGITRDYITIKYAGNDSLYVPCDQLDKVSKFSGKTDTVRLSKMGSADWTKTKTRVKKAAKEMAKQLIALYAERTRRPGYAFAADTDWQNDFESRFEYEETEGQLKAIEEIKRDMEKPCPMDRLLCGDVGFGKTEVALRAAFKCVMDGKQAAILVPTTVLCWQHFRTVLSRMHGFPIKVEMLSRYVSPKKAKEVLAKLKSGEVDIVVGTHKLLAKTVEFKDLGLLIVDEEQRFGVAHKERLKEIAKQVDVLTLTATPIPRTFNMALVGIRDMSVLEEAPIDRHPVQTYVLEHDMFIITEAIKKELRRAGQVFYLHNRVDDIDRVAANLHELIPEANIAVAHGKMSQEELSSAWKDVVDGKTDILVCTTIIETGVDVPNANTLIIEDADRMGLSQLHQIRGRVGRSSRRAYAYFTWRPQSMISEIAEKRLTAIKEFTEFGSGFKIAMRDLEIRGAGNLLGAEQSGHMEAVGYDLFIKLLEQAVLEEKGEKKQKQIECTVDMSIDAFIPENYIKRPAGRIEMYKRIATISGKDDANDVRDELLDRYGDIPTPTENLIKIALLRKKCESAGFVKLEHKNSKLALYPAERPTKEIAIEVASKFAGRVLLSMGDEPCFNIELKAGEDILPVLDEIFKIYSHSTEEKMV